MTAVDDYTTGDGHCWHATGCGLTYGTFGGTDDHRCCHCGKVIAVSRVVKAVTTPGHGPHYATTTTESLFPEPEPCPARSTAETSAASEAQSPDSARRAPSDGGRE